MISIGLNVTKDSNSTLRLVTSVPSIRLFVNSAKAKNTPDVMIPTISKAETNPNLRLVSKFVVFTVTPTQTVTISLIDEGSVTVDSPANVDVTNTGKQRCNIKWSADMDNSGDGEFVTRVRVTFNSTDTTEWFVTDSNISWPTGSDPNSGKQKVFLTEFVETQLSSTFQYDWKIGVDYNDAKLLLSPNNGETDFEVPFELWVNMDSVTSGLEGTLEIQTINAQGAHTTSSDAVVCN